MMTRLSLQRWHSLRPQDLGRRSGTILGDLVVFLIPALQFFEIDIVGRLFAPDLAMLALLPFALRSHARQLSAPLPTTLLRLGLLWLFGQVITDVLRATAFEDYARGWAKIGLFLISFAVLYTLLSNNPRRVLLYGAGICVGGILGFYLNPGVYSAGEPWKFGVGGPITLLLVLCATNRLMARALFLQVLLIASAALINLDMGFRALAGVCLLTAVYLAFFARRRRHHEIGLRPALSLIVICLAAGFAFIKVYEQGAEAGLFGERVRQKYESQAGGQLGLLIGGRGEILVSARAIQDSPILGHGSWAKDPELAWLWLDILRSFGYEAGSSEAAWEGLIPTHSHLFGAWVEAGILGAVFWVWVLFLAFRALLVLPQAKCPLAGLIAFLAFMLMWDVLFSPFGAERRFITAYYLTALVAVLEESRLMGSRA